MMDRSRRTFLKTSAGAAGLWLVGPSTLVQAFTLDGSEYPPGSLQPFSLTSVPPRPRESSASRREINARYLDSMTVDRLLHSFRVTAGISSNVTPYRGWEDPGCELRGHFAGGHYLSAVALASASSGNSTFSMAAAMRSSLASTPARRKNANRYPRAPFLPTFFEKLAQGKPAWAPFYTYHKIMAGLLDMYLYTGNTDALRIAEGMGEWAQEFMWGFGDTQRQRMLRARYGGMNEVLVNLAATTRKKTATWPQPVSSEQPGFLDPLAERS